MIIDLLEPVASLEEIMVSVVFPQICLPPTRMTPIFA
jgi:hypothetical protein